MNVVTYVDVGTATWSIKLSTILPCLIHACWTVQNTNTGLGGDSFTLEQPSFTNSLPGGTVVKSLAFNVGQSDIDCSDASID